jgi:hypothetical protein
LAATSLDGWHPLLILLLWALFINPIKNNKSTVQYWHFCGCCSTPHSRKQGHSYSIKTWIEVKRQASKSSNASIVFFGCSDVRLEFQRCCLKGLIDSFTVFCFATFTMTTLERSSIRNTKHVRFEENHYSPSCKLALEKTTTEKNYSANACRPTRGNLVLVLVHTCSFYRRLIVLTYVERIAGIY